MVSVFDVSAYILHRIGRLEGIRTPITAMKLQKLVYYCQAWSLVWDEAPLFDERIEAWANGPVVPKLFHAHKGQFTVSDEPDGDHGRLTAEQRETVESVLRHYGDKQARWLSDLTHLEDPWRDAREGLPDRTRGNVEITHAAMAEYYGNL